MNAAGYTVIEGNNAFIGYVYLNENADNDLLVDGFERIIGTCLDDADSDNDGKSDGEEVLNFPRTDPIDVVSVCGDVAQPEYPWKDHETGTLYSNLPWNNNAFGFNFTPQINGVIDQLGGYYNGTYAIKLFQKNTGELLAETTVSSNNTWNYKSITPVTVQADVQYTVAVYITGGGSSYRTPGGWFFPKTFDSVRIDGSTQISIASNPNAIPTSNDWSQVFGQVDIRFTEL